MVVIMKEYQVVIQKLIECIAENGDVKECCKSSRMPTLIEHALMVDALYKTGQFLKEEIPHLLACPNEWINEIESKLRNAVLITTAIQMYGRVL